MGEPAAHTSAPPAELRVRRPDRLFAIGLIVVLAFALGARLWRLGDVPTVFFHDECDNTVNAIQILQGRGPGIFGLDWKPQPALAVHLIAASLKVFGPSMAGVRLPTALLTVLALVPFVLVARRVTGVFPALIAALLLACNTGYLHFSRTGWENAQICLWTMLAMEATLRAEEGRSWAWWVVAGLAAAVGAYTYFAGRAIIIFVAAYMVLGLWRRSTRRTGVVGLAIVLLTFAVALAPFVPTLRRHWNTFNGRTRAVLITNALPPGATTKDLVVAMATGGFHGIQTYTRGAINNEPRYYPVGEPILDWSETFLLALGVVVSLWKLRQTLLWWLAFLVPFGATQMLTMGAPNLARGIGTLPIVYLFVALGMWAIVRGARRFGTVAMGLIAVAAVLSLARAVPGYFDWAASERLSRPMHPAIPVGMFDQWWSEQVGYARAGRGMVNLATWMVQHGLIEAPAPPEAVSAAIPVPAGTPVPRRTPVGQIYRGSTTSKPYEIDLGSVTVPGGMLEIEVFAVPGADAVYDYVDVIGADGKRVRAEAEDPRYTTGDTPAKQHRVDDHWWLQQYDAFSGAEGLVALKSENPPSLVTRMQIVPGTYTVRLGSFTGDPPNGAFALQVDVRGGSPATPIPATQTPAEDRSLPKSGRPAKRPES